MGLLVLSIGQCGFDHSRIGRWAAQAGAERTEQAESSEDARRLMEMEDYALVLVNRVFDGDGASGVEFIREMKKTGARAAMMLVSDYASAQEAAMEAGATLGFGKSEREDEVVARLRQVLEK